MNIYICDKNCKECENLNALTDIYGQPWCYECLKFNDTIFDENFEGIKEFYR